MNKLVFIGGGCRGRQSLTLGGLAALREVAIVLFFPFEDIDGAWITTITGPGVPLEDLSHQYLDGAIDRDNYVRLHTRIDAAVSAHASVAVVMPGHPFVGVTIATEYCENPPADCQVNVVDGISSFDTICTDLKRDPLTCGTVAIDVNRMLLYEQTVDPSLDLMLYHVCSIGNQRTEFTDPSKFNRIDLLRLFLLKSRDPKTRAILIESRPEDALDGVRWEGTIDSLEESLEFISFGSTLVVVGQEKPQVKLNQELRESLLASVEG